MPPALIRSAVVVAGGRATRIGGVDKPLLSVGGTSMLQAAVDAAARAGCAEVVVVADTSELHVPTGVRLAWAREEPRHGGPAAALGAGLRLLASDVAGRGWTLVLAADLPRIDRAVDALVPAVRAAAPDVDAVVLVDAGDREQWLTAAYRTASLVAAVADAPPLDGAPVRRVVEALHVERVPAPGGTDDVDTWPDLARARARARIPDQPEGASMSNRTLPPEALDEWAATLRERFGLQPEDLPIPLILDLARDVAHDVARPAAPYSAFAAGFAAGKAGGTPEQTAAAVAAVVELARGWADRGDA